MCSYLLLRQLSPQHQQCPSMWVGDPPASATLTTPSANDHGCSLHHSLSCLEDHFSIQGEFQWSSSEKQGQAAP